MNSTNSPEDAPAHFSDQALLELELQIARRADELAYQEKVLKDRNLDAWMRAEREVLAQ